jgi:methylisocitrate lyase
MSGRFIRAIQEESPLQVVGAINAYCAMLAEQAGFKALYLSGAGVANASFGIPDLGMTNLNDVLEDVRRITAASSLPLLVDIDTGWGHALNIARTVKEMAKAGASAVHIEDQVQAKRCGHRPNKAIVPLSEMLDRIKACVDAKAGKDIAIMARTDALAQEGLNAVIDRIGAFTEAGAEMIFPEAVTTLEQYQAISRQCSVPILANITEFGKTPLFSVSQLKEVGVAIVLYPLSIFRMMSQSAVKGYQTIREQGCQESLVDKMQSRDELYQCLGYHQYEQVIDTLNKGE